MVLAFWFVVAGLPSGLAGVTDVIVVIGDA